MLTDAKNLEKSLSDTINKEANKIKETSQILINTIKSGNKILSCGNGGSAAESQHFVTELVVRFKTNRKAIPAISLTTDTSILTACSNDFSFEDIFSRQVEALANPGDVLICLSTSGNSPNVVKTAQKAKEMNCKVISLTGLKENKLESFSDIHIKVHSLETSRIQEIHLFLLHYFADELEKSI